MKKMNKKFLSGTAFAASAAAALIGCGIPEPNVYGPAPSAQVENGKETTSEVPTVFVPETEVNIDVYGPPEPYDPEEDVVEEEDGEAFNVEHEHQPLVYGPPESLEQEAVDLNSLNEGMSGGSEFFPGDK